MVWFKNQGPKSDGKPPEVKAIERKVIFISIAISLVIFALSYFEIYHLKENKVLSFIRNFSALVIGPVMHPIIRFLYNKRIKAAQAEWDVLHGIDLSIIETRRLKILNRAIYLGQNMGVSISDVNIDESSKNSIQVMGIPVISRIWMSQKAVDELSDDEMDFALAHEIADLKSGPVAKKSLYMISAAIIAISLLFWLTVKLFAPDYSSYMTFMSYPFLACLLLMIAFLFLKRRLEYNVDYLALKETRNLEAAQSTVLKMAGDSTSSSDVISHDLQISRRLATLRRIAERLGLLTSTTHTSTYEREV